MKLKFRTVKRQGEWAEQALVLKTMGMGLNPMIPVGDSTGYDVGVENPNAGSTKRVQVKSVMAKGRDGAYGVNCCRGSSTKLHYGPADADLFAIYVIPENVWYIIPVKVLRRTKHIRLRPQAPGKIRRFEKFRERWELMF